jgi:predicted O-linked N-acetylglucosamine transferase (SPINDLY family)
LENARRLHETGKHADARRLFQKIVRIDPHHADAWHGLGLVEHALGRPRDAFACLAKAASIDATNPGIQRDLGVVCQQLGRTDEALECMQQAVQLAPGDARLHYNLGVVLQEQGHWLGARLRFQQAVRLDPGMALAWGSLAAACLELADYETALVCAEKLRSLEPHSAEPDYLLGNLRLAQRKFEEAVACYVAALEKCPRHVEALNNLGMALNHLGRIEQALHCFEFCARINPSFSTARVNQAALWAMLGRTAEAEAAYEQILKREPGHPRVLCKLGLLWQSLERFTQAEAALTQAALIDPVNAEAQAGLGGALFAAGRIEEASRCYHKAVALGAGAGVRLQTALLLPPVYQSVEHLQQCRAQLEERLCQFEESGARVDPLVEPAAVNFLLAYQGCNDRALQQRIARLYQQHKRRTPHAARRDGRVRVGFVSRHLRDHTIGALFAGLIERLSRRDFHVSVFAIGQWHDQTTARLACRADQYVVTPANIPAAREQILRSGLDLLFYTDLGMEPVSYALALARLARVQCATWGHPVTTGLPTIDYFVSSRLLEPADASDHYSERLIELETLNTYCKRPTPRGTSLARGDFGIPERLHLYLCPQSLTKLHPEFDGHLAEIARRDAAALLLFLEPPHRHWQELLIRRWSQTPDRLNQRSLFIPRVTPDQFLHLLRLADVVLDPPHFGGGNTSYQALGLGVPVVTQPSGLQRGRITAGLYRKMNWNYLVARDCQEYAELAVQMAGDRNHRQWASEQILNRSNCLFEDLAAVEQLERFLLQVAGGEIPPRE